jgi:hypothetical protein
MRSEAGKEWARIPMQYQVAPVKFTGHKKNERVCLHSGVFPLDTTLTTLLPLADQLLSYTLMNHPEKKQPAQVAVKVPTENELSLNLFGGDCLSDETENASPAASTPPPEERSVS